MAALSRWARLSRAVYEAIDAAIAANHGGQMAAPAEWTADGLRSQLLFTRDEPGFTWHRPSGGIDARLEAVPAPAAPRPLVPAWTTLAFVLFAIGFGSAAFARKPPRVALGLGLLAAAVAIVLRPTGPAFLAFGTRAAPQLAELLTDALVAHSGAPAAAATTRLLAAEAAAAEGRNDDAIAGYRAALDTAPPDWPRRSRTANALLFVLMKDERYAEGLALALAAQAATGRLHRRQLHRRQC